MTDERGGASPSSVALPESRDSHSSSPDPSLVSQVEALIKKFSWQVTLLEVWCAEQELNNKNVDFPRGCQSARLV